MKCNLKNGKNILTMIGFVIFALSMAPMPQAFANDQAKAVPSNSNALGMTYGDWSAAWQQYVLVTAIGSSASNIAQNCELNQSSSPVFFLTGDPNGGPVPNLVTRSCDVPAGKMLFFPLINAECSTVEPAPFNGNDAQALRTCASGFMNGVALGSLVLKIDGQNVQTPDGNVLNLKQLRVQSPLYNFIMPAANNFLGVTTGATCGSSICGSSITDGYWVMLNPLSIGPHVIHFEAAIPGVFSQDVTYNITVK